MCNSDRVLEYSALTAMIDHENDYFLNNMAAS